VAKSATAAAAAAGLMPPPQLPHHHPTRAVYQMPASLSLPQMPLPRSHSLTPGRGAGGLAGAGAASLPIGFLGINPPQPLSRTLSMPAPSRHDSQLSACNNQSQVQGQGLGGAQGVPQQPVNAAGGSGSVGLGRPGVSSNTSARAPHTSGVVTSDARQGTVGAGGIAPQATGSVAQQAASAVQPPSDGSSVQNRPAISNTAAAKALPVCSKSAAVAGQTQEKEGGLNGSSPQSRPVACGSGGGSKGRPARHVHSGLPSSSSHR
jgi:hypothetical protein